MEKILLWCVSFCVLGFIYKECLLLYVTRSRVEGLVLESLTTSLFHSYHQRHLSIVDRILTLSVAATILAYILLVFQKIQSASIFEFTVLEVGIVVLIYIIFPSRGITYFISDIGLKSNTNTISWQAIDRVEIIEETTVRRMKQITFRGWEYRVDGFLYERDICCLQQVLHDNNIRYLDK